MANRRGIRTRLGLDSEERRKEWDDRFALGIGVFAGLLVFVTGLGALLMLYRIYEGGPIQSDGNPLGLIFSSRLMLAATRLALLFIGLFVVISILVHVRRGQWLTGVGWLQISDSVKKLSTTKEESDRSADTLEQENQRLQEKLDEVGEQLTKKDELLARISEQLQTSDRE